MQNFSGLKQLRALSAIVLMAYLLLIGSERGRRGQSDRLRLGPCDAHGQRQDHAVGLHWHGDEAGRSGQ